MLTGLTGSSGGLKSILSLLSLIFIFILILVLAYFATKFIAKYQGNLLSSKSNIRIIESIRVANNKFIAIVKIGNSYYAMSLGKDEINLIDKLDPNELNLPEENTGANSQTNDFRAVLARIKDKKANEKNDIK